MGNNKAQKTRRKKGFSSKPEIINEKSKPKIDFAKRVQKDLQEMHIKCLVTLVKTAEQSPWNFQMPSSAIESAMKSISCIKRDGIIENLKFQQESWSKILDSAGINLFKEMQESNAKHLENINSITQYEDWHMPEEEMKVMIFPETYQKPMHPSDADRLDRIEYNLMKFQSSQKETTQSLKDIEKISDFIFNDEGLSISHKGKTLAPLTSSEMILCHKIFSEPAGYNFPTMLLEELLYPNDHTDSFHRRDKFKKVVTRLNNKIQKQTGVKKLFLYSMDFVVQQF